jgi:hypothetical protein
LLHASEQVVTRVAEQYPIRYVPLGRQLGEVNDADACGNRCRKLCFPLGVHASGLVIDGEDNEVAASDV